MEYDLEDQEMLDAANTIISFASSYKHNNKTNSNEYNQQSESSASSSDTSNSIQILKNQIGYYNCKQVIQIPNLLHSLTKLCIYQQNIYINDKEDEQSFQIRQRSRECLISIQKSGDESDQAEVVNVGYIRVFVICLSLAGGTGEHLDSEIYLGLQHISEFISQLHLGRNDYFLPYFSSQPSLSKRCIEQIEEEGGNEEIDSQLINKGNEDLNIKKEADSVKGLILNLLIDEKNPKPSWYYFYI